MITYIFCCYIKKIKIFLIFLLDPELINNIKIKFN